MLKFLLLLVLVAGISATRSDDESFADKISTSNERIIGGNDAKKGQFPYQAMLVSRKHFFCGGSIISARFILTAAQCTQGPLSNPSNVLVHVGSYGRSGYYHYPVDKITNDPKYVVGRVANDISVLRTSSAIQFNSLIQLIPLPTADLPIEGNVTATVSGWGQAKPGLPEFPGNRAKNFQWLDTVTINRKDCIRRLGSLRKKAHKNTICTLNPPNVGICLGDEGGPLTTRDKPRVLIGVVSWSTRVCARGLPDVYVRVFPHLEFIRSAMRD